MKRTKPDSVEIWVRKLNELARKIEKTENSVHPSAWKALLAEEHQRFMALAKQPTATTDYADMPLFQETSA